MENSAKSPDSSAPVAHFLRHLIEADLAAGRVTRVVTRFPPEPNGHLHFGHAKSICINFGLASQYGGQCHLRLDDTNPTTEDIEFVRGIEEAVRWLGFDWGVHHYFASDYFGRLYECAEALVQAGHAYVDSQSAEELRQRRGTLTQAGENSPFRDRPAEESLDLLRRMRAGEFGDGTHVLRAKIDMASPNMNLRDPLLYRIRHAHHHRTGDAWCIYPLYDYAHPLSDAFEGITHSICTLEFEDHRPLYDWLVDRVRETGLLPGPGRPHQYEFSRLNLTTIVLSKRKLLQLVEQGHVSGWDDPRMPTLAGARRRGYPAEGFRRFVEQSGVSKSDGWIDYSVLEGSMRDVLNEQAPRRVAVLDPLELVIENLPEDTLVDCTVANHPQKPELGGRTMPFRRRLWIEREDFQEVPVKGFFRLSPGAKVRLKYAYVAECTGFEKDEAGRVVRVMARIFEDSRSGTPGADLYKVKGNLHWVAQADAVPMEVRLYDRLFTAAVPGARREGDPEDLERDFLDDLNPHSLSVIQAYGELALATDDSACPVQFERHGYFVQDSASSQPGALVYNKTVGLRGTT